MRILEEMPVLVEWVLAGGVRVQWRSPNALNTVPIWYWPRTNEKPGAHLPLASQARYLSPGGQDRDANYVSTPSRDRVEMAQRHVPYG
jgi:hypothetical protein